jgi:hypothetical protein
MARFQDARWEAAQELSSGSDWFVNWADFPRVCVLGDRHLLASFLERTAPETYAYRVRITQSADGGGTWSPPATLHSDTSDSEHGFVSLAAAGDRFWSVWLDGRSTVAEPRGPMALLARTLTPSGELGPELLIDERVCDCCQTALAVHAGDVYVAYRDRSQTELRDVSLVRVTERGVEPVWESRDGWEIAGCPVNGPALAENGAHVGLAWFSAAQERPRVACALFAGGSPRRWELAGADSIGRVDAVFDSRGLLIVTWLEQRGSEAMWRVARVDPSSGPIDVFDVAPASPSRTSGFGRLAPYRSGAVFAFTEDTDPPRVALRLLEWK